MADWAIILKQLYTGYRDKILVQRALLGGSGRFGRMMGEIRAEKTLQKSEKEKSRFNKYFPLVGKYLNILLKTLCRFMSVNCDRRVIDST